MHPKVLLTLLLFALTPAHRVPADLQASDLSVPPETAKILDDIYGFRVDAAIRQARHMQVERPDHPLGYLLEGEALWYRIWCESMDYKYGMTDARRRARRESDQAYLDLATKVSSLARAHLKKKDSAEMHFYAGMGDALAARLYALRGENRATARAGVRAREQFLAASKLDPQLTDADLGLGLYNYYVDTLSAIAKMLRFFMGIPGGSKQEGLRQLETVIAGEGLASNVARFYLVLNLHRYDQQYARALKVLAPLLEKYPANPIFQLMAGDLEAKLGHKKQALEHYRIAEAIAVSDAECRQRIREVTEAALAALGPAESAASR